MNVFKWGRKTFTLPTIPEPYLPAPHLVLRALELTSFENVRCVILGQDPYPTKGHANGLAFSVYPHVSPVPRSLQNIFREYSDDLGLGRPRNGNLEKWAREGVLLLNTILTVQEGRPLSHAGLGWEARTSALVRQIAREKDNVVFILWGQKAQEFAGAIDEQRHLCIRSPHPSPLSAHWGFFGSRPFSRTNQYLRDHHLPEIQWRLT